MGLVVLVRRKVAKVSLIRRPEIQEGARQGGRKKYFTLQASYLQMSCSTERHVCAVWFEEVYREEGNPKLLHVRKNAPRWTLGRIDRLS